MIFYKSLASLGIGGATVDTRLEGSRFYPGETVKGEVFVRGGNSPQEVEDIYLYLVVTVNRNHKKIAHAMEKYRLSQSFTLQVGEHKRIPFQIRLPMETPMSTGSFPLYLKTGLDIKMAIDPTDLDRIEVFPAPLVQKLLKQMEDTGFILYHIHNEYDPDQKPFPFFQMFQFRPTGRYHGYVDNMNIIFNVSETGVEMDVEMIRSERILNSAFSWKFSDPDGTLTINSQKVQEDPLQKIDELLNQKP